MRHEMRASAVTQRERVGGDGLLFLARRHLEETRDRIADVCANPGVGNNVHGHCFAVPADSPLENEPIEDLGSGELLRRN
jgi:hypothetical protein